MKGYVFTKTEINNRVDLQLLGWLIFGILYLLYCYQVVGLEMISIRGFLITFSFHFLVFYFNTITLLPALNKREYPLWKMFLVLCVELLVINLLIMLLSLALGSLQMVLGFSMVYQVLISNFFPVFLPFAVSLMLSFFYFTFWADFHRSIQKENNNFVIAHQEKLKSELCPHLFVNAAYIVDYAIDHEPTLAKKVNGLLNEMMLYYLQETPHGYSPISKEIVQVRNYITLNQIRWSNKKYLDLDCQGDLSAVNTLPMLVMLLVENIFKYGVLDDPNHPAKVLVHVHKDRLRILARNDIHQDESILPSTGIGLNNLRARLAHFYPRRHNFSVKNTGSSFSVELTINLVEGSP